MAETVEVLNAKVVVDASSVTQAQSQYNTAIDSMASSTRAKFGDMKAQTDSLIAKSQDLAKFRKESMDRIKQVENEAATSTRSWGQSVRSAFLEIGTAVATVAGPIMLAVGAFNELQKAAEFRGMAQATRNMANSFGVDMARIMRALDEASNSTLTAQDKFRLMNEAMLAGGSEVADKLPQLVEIARAAAIASGVQFETVFQKLLLGIARGSARLIDDARIYLRVGSVVENYAKSMGIATEEVDAQTRSRLVLNAVLQDGSKIVQAVGKDTLAEADAFKQLNAQLEQTPQILSQFIDATGGVQQLTVAIGALNQVIALSGQAFVGYSGLIGNFLDVIHGRTSILGLPTAMQESMRRADETFKRMIIPMGITSGGEDDPRERARRKSAQQAQTFAEQEAAAEQDRLEATQKARDKMNDIIISSGEKAHDSERSWMQDVIDLNIDHQRRLVEIALDGARKRQDIELDFARKIEDADLEYQQAIEDAQFQSASRRAEIEQRYQERLYQIQRRFQDSYWNAVKTRDAVALVEAVRERDRGIAEATQQRDQDIGNEDAQEQQRIQNAQVAHQRKIEDAQRYYERAMQDQRIAQQRAIEDENLEHQYREIELRRHFDWRIQEIDRAMNQELATAQVKYAQAEADYSAHLAQMAAIAAAYMSQLGIGGPSSGGGYTNPRTRKRQSGGVDLVNGPTPFLAGEGGPELVLTVPMGGNQQMLPAPMSHTVSGDVRHQVDMIAANGMRGMEARIIAATMQALREVYRR